MHQVHDFADRLDVLLKLRVFDYQGRRDLEHQEIVPADLTEYLMVAQNRITTTWANIAGCILANA